MKRKRKRLRIQARVDLDALIFDGDRDLRSELRRDPLIKDALRQARPAEELASIRRELLLSSLKLTPAIAPDMYRAVDRVSEALGLEAPIEAYCVSSPEMNAFIAPPVDQRLLIGVSSPLLEKMSEDELTFVVGHEVGHVLFDHFSMAPSVVLELEQRLPPTQVARMYAWMRYAELSADRVGLLCAQDIDATVRAFFKLTSGLCDERFLQNARQAAAQLDELSAAESTVTDWFSTHPYGPLRIKAIEAFHASSTYHSLVGKVGGDMTEAELEAQVAAIMKLMDPTFEQHDVEYYDELRELLVLGGLTVAMADGTLDRSEEAELERLVGGDLVISDEALAQLADGAGDARLKELGKFVAMRVPEVRRKKLVEDLTAIAVADERLANSERKALRRCARYLDVDPQFIDETLARIHTSLD